MSVTKRHIVSHTAMRGIAALVVVMYHLGLNNQTSLFFEDWTRFFDRGYLWVDFFFILSGFIMCYIYLADRQRPMSLAEVKQFGWARFSRIYPLHFATLMFMAIFFLAIEILGPFLGLTLPEETISFEALKAFVAHLFLIQTWGFSNIEFWNVPAWSISAEAHAYVLFPLLVLAVLRGRKPVWAFMAVGTASFYILIFVTTADLNETVGVALLRCIAGFMLGMLVFKCRKVEARLTSRAVSGVQVALIGIVVLLTEFTDNDSLLILPYACLVLFTWQDRGILGRLLNNRVSKYLGEISYSIYMVHVPVIACGGYVFARAIAGPEHFSPEVTRFLWICFVYIGTLITAAVTYRFVEKPARRFLTRQKTA